MKANFSKPQNKSTCNFLARCRGSLRSHPQPARTGEGENSNFAHRRCIVCVLRARMYVNAHTRFPSNEWMHAPCVLPFFISAGRGTDFFVTDDDGCGEERASAGGNGGRGGRYGSRGHGVRHSVAGRCPRRHREAQAGEVRGLPSHARGELWCSVFCLVLSCFVMFRCAVSRLAYLS